MHLATHDIHAHYRLLTPHIAGSKPPRGQLPWQALHSVGRVLVSRNNEIRGRRALKEMGWGRMHCHLRLLHTPSEGNKHAKSSATLCQECSCLAKRVRGIRRGWCGVWCAVATCGGGEAVVWKGALSKCGITFTRFEDNTKKNPKLALESWV
jgi:hypothetical protein